MNSAPDKPSLSLSHTHRIPFLIESARCNILPPSLLTLNYVFFNYARRKKASLAASTAGKTGACTPAVARRPPSSLPAVYTLHTWLSLSLSSLLSPCPPSDSLVDGISTAARELRVWVARAYLSLSLSLLLLYEDKGEGIAQERG